MPGKDDNVEAMQNAHIANFKRLFDEGKLFMAGPLQDPSKIKRGIIGVRAPDRETLMSYFKPDPYVMSGIMAVDANEWKVDMSKVATSFSDPDKIEEHRFAIVKAIRPTTAGVLKQHEQYVKDRLKPALNGLILRNKTFEEILFFKSTDTDALNKLFDQDPLVRLGYAVVELMPLWMSPETIK